MMNSKKLFKETSPLKSNSSNIQPEQDSNASIQSDINLTNNHSPIELINQNNINNTINENLKQQPEQQEGQKNEEDNDNNQPRNIVRLKSYFQLRNFPLIVVGTNSKFLFYIKYF